MNLRDFRRAGHVPTLLSAFLYFDVSFMVWLLPGALANSIVPEFGLSDSQKGLDGGGAAAGRGGAAAGAGAPDRPDRRAADGHSGHVADDRYPCCWAGSGPTASARCSWSACSWACAGASFAAALPLASRWYPPRYQGLAMGIAGAGNSGTALATFFGPRLALVWGWHAVFGLALIPLLADARLLPRSSPRTAPTSPRLGRLPTYADVLKMRDTWWFCLLYSITFGGFVGLASFLNVFFLSQYGLSRVQAGNFATLCVIAGSVLRPLGGYLADRFGGVRMLTGLYLDRWDDDARPGDAAAAVRWDAAAVRDHGDPGHGQRRGVPARPAAVPQGDRRDDRDRRGRGRVRRILAADRSGLA